VLVTGGILAVALGVVAYATWWLLRARSMTSAQSFGIAIVAMWITSMAVVLWRYDEPRGRSELVRSLDSLAWPTTQSPPLPPPRSAAIPPAAQVASVDSLVGGLEARLAANPDDAEDWALLAQSYAYTANAEAVERAVQRAVALGVDESSLRERVANAKRNTPPVDWVEHATRAPRP